MVLIEPADGKFIDFIVSSPVPMNIALVCSVCGANLLVDAL